MIIAITAAMTMSMIYAALSPSSQVMTIAADLVTWDHDHVALTFFFNSFVFYKTPSSNLADKSITSTP
jgi:hypothetical protein